MPVHATQWIVWRQNCATPVSWLQPKEDILKLFWAFIDVHCYSVWKSLAEKDFVWHQEIIYPYHSKSPKIRLMVWLEFGTVQPKSSTLLRSLRPETSNLIWVQTFGCKVTMKKKNLMYGGTLLARTPRELEHGGRFLVVTDVASG